MVVCDECLEKIIESGEWNIVYKYEAPYYATRIKCQKCGKEFEKEDFDKLSDVA